MPGSSQYPLVGNAGDLSIVAHEQYAQSEEPVFEIADGRRMSFHWSREILRSRARASRAVSQTSSESTITPSRSKVTAP